MSGYPNRADEGIELATAGAATLGLAPGAAAAAAPAATSSSSAALGNGQCQSNDNHEQHSAAATEVVSSEYLDFLRKFHSVWRDQPDLYISWKDLSYTARIPLKDTSVPNLVSSVAHGLANMVRRPIRAITGAKDHTTQELKALQPCSGVIRPGSMTLVLAPPGHGKTMLLKSLSGRLSHDAALTGEVRFNNLTGAENLARGVHVSRLAAYVGQSDLLFPVLTVNETLKFAADSSLPDAHLLLEDPSLSPADRKVVEDICRDDPQRYAMLIKLLGLAECAETIVGNDLMRGVSGGQKKRVGLGEMLLSNARAFFLDEVSTGLDAAVTLHIFSALKQLCAVTKASVVVALLQPTPETYALFDDIILLQDGRTVFHGPRDDLPKWLWEVAGLEVPHGVDEAGFVVDFLSDPRLQYELARKARENLGIMAAVDEHEHEAEQQPGKRAVVAVSPLNATATTAMQSSTPTHVNMHLTPNDEEYDNVQLENGNANNNHAAVPQAHEQDRALLSAAPQVAASPSGDASAVALVDPRRKGLRGGMSSSVAPQYHSQAPGAPVHSSAQLADHYRASTWFHAMATEVSLAQSRAQRLDPAAWTPYTRAQYAQRYPHTSAKHTVLNMARQYKLTVRNRSMVPPRIAQSIIMGVIFGTLFIQLPKDKFADRMGLLLYVIMTGAFANLTELPVASEARNVVSKQIDAGFFPSLSYTLSVAVMHIPLTIIETIIFGNLMYWIPGFYASAGNYFFFLFILFINSNALSVFFRCISYVAKNPDVARQMDMPFIVIFVIFGGFLIAYDNIPKWLIWLFYMSPFGWGVRSLALNEFHSPAYTEFDSEGVSKGDLYLRSFGVFTDSVWLWMGPIYLAGIYIIFLGVGATLLNYIKPITPMGTRKTEMKISGEHAEGPPEEVAGMDATPQQRHVAPVHHSHHNSNGASNGHAHGHGHGHKAARHGSSNGDSLTIQVGAASVHGVGGKGLKNSKASFQLTALPFVPVTLAWKNINYSVEVGAGKDKHSRQLLCDISGFAAPGKMTALMGSSGAGKTTLMDVIAGRKTMGTITGDILVNGFAKDPHTFEKLTGYVEQNDIHIGTATVREALLFSAKLRLPMSVSDSARETFVQEVMQLVGLSHIAGRLIGDAALPGLSQGQLKLVTIAVELVANPSVIFLDEPTSGLDAPSAARVMKAVRRIAGTGRTVLCTIHQPSEALFLMFDRLLLLKSGGQTVYFSDIGRKGSKLVDYFEAASDYQQLLPRGGVTEVLPNGRKKVSLRISPANWMLDVIGAAGQHNEDLADYAKIWRESKLNGETSLDVEEAARAKDGQHAIKLDGTYVTSWTRYREVQSRLFVSHWRNGPMNLTRFLLMIIFGMLLGVVYYDLDTGDFGGVNSKLSVIFLAMSFPSSICAGSALPTFFRQRAVYYRETTVGLYGPNIFHLANFLTEVPYICACVFVFLCPFYYMIGFLDNSRLFFEFWLMAFLMCICYSSLSQLWLALLPNQIAANVANGMLMNLFFMFGGLFIKPSSIPQGWKWFHYIDPIPKAFIPVALGQFWCDTEAAGNSCPLIKADPTSAPQYTYTYLKDLLEQDSSDYGNMVGYLILEIVVIRLFVALALKKVSHIKR